MTINTATEPVKIALRIDMRSGTKLPCIPEADIAHTKKPIIPAAAGLGSPLKKLSSDPIFALNLANLKAVAATNRNEKIHPTLPKSSNPQRKTAIAGARNEMGGHSELLLNGHVLLGRKSSLNDRSSS